MKCHPVRWIWGLIPVVMLSWIAVHAEARRIERDLHSRAHAALAAGGYDWASIVFSGRNGMLVGTPRRPREPAEAAALVRGVWGVASVTERTRPFEDVAVRGIVPDVRPGAGPSEALPAPAIVLLPEMRPSSVAGADPSGIAEPQPDTIRADEQAAPAEGASRSDAQKSQDGLSTVAINTAALAPKVSVVEHDCILVAQEIGTSEPVRFARGKVALDGRSKAFLDRLAAAASACSAVALTISGHADAYGAAKRNMLLSQRRARVVVGYLIAKGIDAGRLMAVGYGETRPVAPNDTAQNRAKNRRIEVEVGGLRPAQDGSAAAAQQGAGNGLFDR